MAMNEVVIKDEPTGPEAPAPQSTRPENIPEKFWDEATKSVNTEALLKSYTELEGRLGGPKETPPTTEEPPQEGQQENPEDQTAEEAAEAAGIDIGELEAHFAEHGSLPEDAYERLAAVGIGKELVDEYVAYRTQQAEAIQKEIVTQFGGDEVVNRMLEWAGQNWTDEQATAFNEAMGSKSRAKIDMAMQSLEAAYTKANPRRPTLLKPTAAPATGGVQAFRSNAEMVRAMSDPRYRTDEAYRQEVAQRIAGMK